jgi:hypothetical protein
MAYPRHQRIDLRKLAVDRAGVNGLVQQRFLMIKELGGGDEPATSARLILVQIWFEELKRRVPTK